MIKKYIYFLLLVFLFLMWKKVIHIFKESKLKLSNMIKYYYGVMKYKSKKFLIDGFNVSKIAKIYKTPVYCYSFKNLKKISKF